MHYLKGRHVSLLRRLLVYLDFYVLGDDTIDKLGVFHANQIYICLDP